MVIDLKLPKIILKDKIDEFIFNYKIQESFITKNQLVGAATLALTFSNSKEVFAMQSGSYVNELIYQDLYVVLFSILEILRQYSYVDLKAMDFYFKYLFFKKNKR
ncbi:hypothetical protein [Clostridium cylindrosporum]|uniref:Uncharacterized protein n=1 Tax=Clostridium cylindrosporum DSM 605 TaxID=1121307 RepID=A0A0J8D5E8_CLOCY|nr:hypothetical protein [Clostridium cylindrosporum]KMT21042.1 hypothetical protein CLCY_1c02760 [Clostridium cylindrosporum DSM 605]